MSAKAKDAIGAESPTMPKPLLKALKQHLKAAILPGDAPLEGVDHIWPQFRGGDDPVDRPDPLRPFDGVNRVELVGHLSEHLRSNPFRHCIQRRPQQRRHGTHRDT